MTDSVMMHAFPTFPEIPEDLKKEVGCLKKDWEFKHSIGTLRTETMELKYQRLASDCKAMEEAMELCFRKCEKNVDMDVFTTTMSSIYEEIAVLAKYQRDTRIKYLAFEGMLVQQEKRHAQEMQRVEKMLFEQAKKHTEEMNSLVTRLEKIYQKSSEKETIEKVEISSDNEDRENEDIKDSEDSDDDIFILSDSDEIKRENTLPIAQSLSEMLYETSFPTL